VFVADVSEFEPAKAEDGSGSYFQGGSDSGWANVTVANTSLTFAGNSFETSAPSAPCSCPICQNKGQFSSLQDGSEIMGGGSFGYEAARKSTPAPSTQELREIMLAEIDRLIQTDPEKDEHKDLWKKVIKIITTARPSEPPPRFTTKQLIKNAQYYSDQIKLKQMFTNLPVTDPSVINKLIGGVS
jgi:hypothetical protein